MFLFILPQVVQIEWLLNTRELILRFFSADMLLN